MPQLRKEAPLKRTTTIMHPLRSNGSIRSTVYRMVRLYSIDRSNGFSSVSDGPLTSNAEQMESAVISGFSTPDSDADFVAVEKSELDPEEVT